MTSLSPPPAVVATIIADKLGGGKKHGTMASIEIATTVAQS